MTLISLLMFSPEFNLEGELCKISVLSFHPLIKTKFNYLQQGKEEIKGMHICCMKKNPLQ